MRLPDSETAVEAVGAGKQRFSHQKVPHNPHSAAASAE